jgi:hypothetical protein
MAFGKCGVRLKKGREPKHNRTMSNPEFPFSKACA